MAKYEDFISHNVAIPGAERIGIYNQAGNKVGQIPLGNLRLKNTGKKLYSFGVLSDTHVGYSSNTDEYFSSILKRMDGDDNIEFICICGDVVENALDDWAKYEDMIGSDRSKPIYAVSGNHEQLNSHRKAVISMTGLGTVGSFMHRGDVFIMLGCHRYGEFKLTSSWTSTVLCQWYKPEDLRRIYETFERYRNRRCFVFHHHQILNTYLDYHINMLRPDGGAYIPLSLFQHYKNATVFHGHTHTTFSSQLNDPDINYNTDILGCRSVHIPSTKNGQFYIADVYQYGMHLQGYDILNGGIVPYASYWIDTRLVDVDAGSYHWDRDMEEV